MKAPSGKKGWTASITGVAAVIATLALLLDTAIPIGDASPHGGSHAVDHAVGSGGILPAAIGAAQLYVNRSQSSGTYVKEFVSLNNSSTLTPLPLNGGSPTTFHGCEWVTVVNATVTVDTFHVVRYAKVTTGNGTGTVVVGLAKTSFDACAGSAYFVDYTMWTYSIYDFTAKVLGINSTLDVAFDRYPGSLGYPTNVSLVIGPKTVAQLKAPTNISFNVTANPVNGTTTCTASSLSQVCSYPRWTLSEWTQAASGTAVTGNPFEVGGTTGLTPVGATYSNWSVIYTETNVSANTATGIFFLEAGSWLNTIFVQFWYLWVLLVVGIVVYALARGGRRGRRG
ncbi:MAG TPA: hypothetical protein VFF67_07795 [Thermoplasmata archaeon]|nr:hypothetical protein [Thermoplasmata archaeon]